ncbi:MAG: hypothetical protein ACTSXC_06930 [Candidatus Freyarchaeota archaeon]
MSGQTFIVDFWRTGIHREEFGIRQKEFLMSKSRQFTRDLDLCGRLKRGSEEIGYIGYRRGVWDLKEAGRLDKQRLVIKAFSNSFSWMGSIEEVVNRTVSKSIGVGEVMPVFAAVLPDNKLVYNIERVYRGPLRTVTYVFSFIDEKSKTFQPVKIVGKRVSLGADFDVFYGADEQRIGRIDGKIADLGGRFEVKILDETLVRNEELMRVLLLFTSTLKFHSELEERVKRLLEAMRKGDLIPEVQSEELGLLVNPRVLRSAIF